MPTTMLDNNFLIEFHLIYLLQEFFAILKAFLILYLISSKSYFLMHQNEIAGSIQLIMIKIINAG